MERWSLYCFRVLLNYYCLLGKICSNKQTCSFNMVDGFQPQSNFFTQKIVFNCTQPVVILPLFSLLVIFIIQGNYWCSFGGHFVIKSCILKLILSAHIAETFIIRVSLTMEDGLTFCYIMEEGRDSLPLLGMWLWSSECKSFVLLGYRYVRSRNWPRNWQMENSWPLQKNLPL